MSELSDESRGLYGHLQVFSVHSVGSSLSNIDKHEGVNDCKAVFRRRFSRFRLINIKLGSYIEIFLTTVSKLYPLGGDVFSVKASQANTISRGKLDLYKVTVMSVEPMAVKYIIYLMSLVLRYYRSSIMKYVKSK